jgi:hypothetical protein
MTSGRRRLPSRPAPSSFELLRQVAARFRPAYAPRSESRSGLRIVLGDARGEGPDIVLRHRQARRLFFRANALVVQADVPGRGPPADGELRFRFRGPLSRQRASLRWKQDVPEGGAWTKALEGPLQDGLAKIEAVESFQVRWNARAEVWRLELRTLSGSLVGGFMTAMPIPVPFDTREASGIVELVDALAATRRSSLVPGDPDPPPQQGRRRDGGQGGDADPEPGDRRGPGRPGGGGNDGGRER